MQSLGKRLEEARKERGVSLREASEATKIRTSYLACFENDDHDIPLPDIYKRGFLKLYARYLKMDPAEVAREVRLVMERRNNQQARAESRSGLGQMDLGRQGAGGAVRTEGGDNASDDRGARAGSGGRGPIRLGRLSIPQMRGRSDRPETEIHSMDPGDDVLGKDFYIKAGIAITGVVLGVILIVLLLQLLFGGNGRAADPVDGNPSAEVLGTTVPDNVMLVTSGVGTRFVLRDPQTRAVLFDERLPAGEERAIPVDVVPEVIVTDGSNLRIRYRGETFTLNRPGQGRIKSSEFE